MDYCCGPTGFAFKGVLYGSLSSVLSIIRTNVNNVFIYDRYQTFWQVKRQNQQWPPMGRLLWDKCRNQQRDAYVRKVLAFFNSSAA